jgi:hypothetical protein
MEGELSRGKDRKKIKKAEDPMMMARWLVGWWDKAARL